MQHLGIVYDLAKLNELHILRAASLDKSFGDRTAKEMMDTTDLVEEVVKNPLAMATIVQNFMNMFQLKYKQPGNIAASIRALQTSPQLVTGLPISIRHSHYHWNLNRFRSTPE